MLSYNVPHNCKRDIPRPHWSAFLERLTEEQQNRQVTVQISEAGQGSVEESGQTLFRLIDYESLTDADYLTIVVIKERGRLSATYEHVVENPRKIEVFYEQDNCIFAVAVIDESGGRTTVYLEDDAAMVYRRPQTLRPPLLETAQPLEYALSFHY